jgi:hypothetical protein
MPELITCHVCGHENRTGAKFCGACGAELGVTSPAQCPACREPLQGQERFCPACGTSLRGAPAPLSSDQNGATRVINRATSTNPLGV